MIRRVVWPHGALLLFVLVIRLLPGIARPASLPDDCERVARTDAAALERCIALKPDDVELMMDAAAVYEKTGRADRAEALYRRAMTVDPDDGEVRRRLSMLTTARRAGGT